MLVGREAERARIAELLGSVRAGQGGALLLRGEPGIGKSALLGFAGEHASGLRVLRARGVEAEADLPFSALVELLRPLLGLLDVLPEAQSEAMRGTFALGPQMDGKLLIGLATVSLLSAAAEEQPLLCVVDDAHWLDVASAEAFVFAARRLEDDPVAFLFGARVGEPRRFSLPGAAELELGGLSPGEGQELLARSGRELAPGVGERLHEVVRGNPLALLELPSALAEDQLSGVQPLVEPLPVTEAIQQAFARRIERLPEQTRGALVVVAAEPSGRVPPVERALAVVGLELSALDAAEDAGLLRLVAGEIEFRHPLVRAAAYHGGRSSERRRAHAALAEAASVSRDADARAWHLAAAAAGTDEVAAAALEDVGVRAKGRGTLVAAVAAFERAAALSPDPEQQARRLCRAVRGYERIRGTKAWSRASALVVEALAQTDDPSLKAELGYWQGCLQIETDLRRAYELLLARASEVADTNPAFASLIAGEAAYVALAKSDRGDLLAASAAARRYARRAAGPADPYVSVVRALALIESGRAAAGGPLQAAARRVIDRYAVLVAEGADYTEQGLPFYRVPVLIRAVVLVADPSQLRVLAELYERMRAVWGSLGDNGTHLTASVYLGRYKYDAGRWAEARADLAELERICNEQGENAQSLWWASTHLAQLAAARGAEVECRTYHEAAAAFGFRRTGFPGKGALALLALGRGEYDRAVEEYERALLPSLGAFVLSNELADALEAYVHVGRREDAEPWLAQYTEQARATGWAWARARAAHLRLLLASDDRLDQAFEAAMAFHNRAEQPFPRARTDLVYGERLRRAGLRRQAREHLRAALQTFERLEATPWAEHAATELRATGERVRRRRDADTSRLTPQELQVALAVARGATNREVAARLYLSPKTIEKHLGSVYRKLGLHSRTELANVLGVGMQPTEIPAAV
jgi:DNA-binding CsgD family transcriptional regulator